MLAVELAETAIATCLASGYKTTTLVADSAGVPVAMLSADGVGAPTQGIAANKVAMVIVYREPSGATVERARSDPALAAALKADPRIGTPRRGALPLMADGALIGAVGVSGAPGGEKDEACGQAGIDKVRSRLR